MRIPRALKSFRHFGRIPEVLRCRHHTTEWRRLTAAYVGLRSELPLDIALPSGRFRFTERGDLATFWQIFYRRIYQVRPSDRLIVDAGANIGAFSLYALLTAPQCRVVSVEPAPDSFNRVRETLKAHGVADRCEMHSAALGSTTGETTIELNCGSQFRRTGFGGAQAKAMTLDSLIPRDATVDLLKMDIEGAEYEVLESAPFETLRRIQRVVIEFHPNAPASRAIEPLLRSGLTVTRRQEEEAGYGMVWLERHCLPGRGNGHSGP